LYALTEKIKPDKNRLDISKLTDTDLLDYDLTGGYIFWSFDNLPTQIYYPNSNKIQPEQEDYIEAFFNRYREVIFSNNWLDQEIDYRDYVNTESMLDYLIINELAYDHDKYRSSTFMYKDRSDKDSLINFGPLWDYNYAYGNTLNTLATDKWRFSDDTGDQFRRLFQDTGLTYRFAEKWQQQRDNFLHTDSLYSLIDSLTNHFSLARKRDSMVWDAYTTVNIYFAMDTVYRYDLVIRNLKDWLDRRTRWIDTHIDSIFYPMSGVESIFTMQHSQEKSLKAYPNPFRNELEIELNCNSSGALQFTLYNMQGQVTQQWHLKASAQGWQTHSLTLRDKIPPGLYLLTIHDNEKQVGKMRVVKSE
jgi:hypothetical protein